VKGFYNENSIVVDHLILTGNELDRLKIGKKVCVAVRKENEIGHRYDDEILRKFSDEVKIFYIGSIYKKFKNSPCSNK
jgi:hypothetical protein